MITKSRSANANNGQGVKSQGKREAEEAGTAGECSEAEENRSWAKPGRLKGYEFAIMGWCLISCLGGKEISGLLLEMKSKGRTYL